jgi:hypothetical protein
VKRVNVRLWIGLGALIVPAIFIVRSAVAIMVFHADALPEIFWWLAIAMAMLALYAFYHGLRGMFGASTSSDALRATLPERAALLDEKNALLRAIKDIAYEHDVGKLSDQEFERLDRSYRTRAKDVLRKLDDDIAPYVDRAEKIVADHLHKNVGPLRTPDRPAHKGAKKKKKKPSAQPQKPAADVIADAKEMLREMARDTLEERARERGLTLPEDAKAGEPCPHCDALNEALSNRCGTCDARLTRPTCSKCETVNELDAQFCKKCATPIDHDAEGLP